MSLAMAQATARGDLRALATYIRTCERSGGLSVEDMKRVCDHIIAADEYSLEVEAKSEPGLLVKAAHAIYLEAKYLKESEYASQD